MYVYLSLAVSDQLADLRVGPRLGPEHDHAQVQLRTLALSGVPDDTRTLCTLYASSSNKYKQM